MKILQSNAESFLKSLKQSELLHEKDDFLGLFSVVHVERQTKFNQKMEEAIGLIREIGILLANEFCPTIKPVKDDLPPILEQQVIENEVKALVQNIELFHSVLVYFERKTFEFK